MIKKPRFDTIDEDLITTEDIIVQSQETPNPHALKFIVNRPLKLEGKATFKVDSPRQGLKLIESVFEIKGTQQVYIQGSTLTFTHSGQLDNDDVRRHMESILKTRLPVHNPSFEMEDKTLPNQKSQPSLKKNTHGVLNEIEEILDRTIRPGLQADGGDLEIMSYKDNELCILYQGACGGCPSAMMGTLDAIQSILRHELNNSDLKVIPL